MVDPRTTPMTVKTDDFLCHLRLEVSSGRQGCERLNVSILSVLTQFGLELDCLCGNSVRTMINTARVGCGGVSEASNLRRARSCFRL